MRAVRLLHYAVSKEPEKVLDVGVGPGKHAIAFLGQGARVTGIDPRNPPLEHPLYEHHPYAYELAEFEDESFDMIFTSHVIEHVPNVQHFLVSLRRWLKPGGWLMLAAPTSSQERLHIGHLSLWTPAHLIYNLICAGWNCKDAEWYTEYLSIGVAVQKTDDIDLSWRTSLPSEQSALNQFSPVYIRHEEGAWWGNRWPEKLEPERMIDPPFVTIGLENTPLLPPQVKLSYGPNPALRKAPHGN